MKNNSTTTKRCIDRMLTDGDERSDTSLRGSALRRALAQDVPKTLTPYEWQEWCEIHGVPESHVHSKKDAKRRWWRLCAWFKVWSKTRTSEQ